MGSIGLPELLIVLVVVLVLFGVGRIARVGGELGKGVSAFRQGLRDGQETPEQDAIDKQSELPGPPPA
jgi:sec-independent protein translocase protein TatA